jgi:predicted Zn-dependent peptidase
MLPGPPNGFPGFSEYVLANVLLGNSMSSRGNAALRLHDAKSYGVWSRLERRQAGSELQVFFDVEQDDFVESLQRILGEVERLRRELVSEDELAVAKIAWQAQLSSRLVTSSGTVAVLGEGFALDGDPAVLGPIADRVERVRPADIQQVARREFTSDRLQVVVFASRQKLEAALRHVGPIWWQAVGPG